MRQPSGSNSGFHRRRIAVPQAPHPMGRPPDNKLQGLLGAGVCISLGDCLMQGVQQPKEHQYLVPGLCWGVAVSLRAGFCSSSRASLRQSVGSSPQAMSSVNQE
jgi:hypothetical protein